MLKVSESLAQVGAGGLGGERRGVARGGEQAVVAVVDDLQRAPGGGGDDRSACELAFDDHAAERLRLGRGVNDRVARLHQGGDVVAVAEPVDAARERRPRRAFA